MKTSLVFGNSRQIWIDGDATLPTPSLLTDVLTVKRGVVTATVTQKQVRIKRVRKLVRRETQQNATAAPAMLNNNLNGESAIRSVWFQL